MVRPEFAIIMTVSSEQKKLSIPFSNGMIIMVVCLSLLRSVSYKEPTPTQHLPSYFISKILERNQIANTQIESPWQEDLEVL